MYCVLFNGGSSNREIQLVHALLRHGKMLNIVLGGTLSQRQGSLIREFLKQVSWKKDPVDQQLSTSIVKEVDKIRGIYIIYIHIYIYIY